MCDNDTELAAYFENLPASKEQLLSFMEDVKKGKKGTLKNTKQGGKNGCY
jgi:hypothetical protein